MNYRQLLCSALAFVTLFAINTGVLHNYYKTYHTGSLASHWTVSLKHRCIRYYDKQDFNNFTNIICKPYKYEYVIFNFGRSQYIALCYGLNLITMFIYIIIYLGCLFN